MDAEELAEYVRQSCEAQGVPVKVTDPAVIRKVAALMGARVHAPQEVRHDRDPDLPEVQEPDQLEDRGGGLHG